MDIGYLRSSKYAHEHAAQRAEEQARRYERLASQTQEQFIHKRDQLAKARVVLSKCQTVKTVSTRFDDDVRDTARHIDIALNAGGIIITAFEKSVRDNAQVSEQACCQAKELVERLEKECQSLQQQLTSYRNTAAQARNQASAHYRSADALQWQINMAQ